MNLSSLIKKMLSFLHSNDFTHNYAETIKHFCFFSLSINQDPFFLLEVQATISVILPEKRPLRGPSIDSAKA